MLYRIQHTTIYKYHETVPLCHNLAMLTPRDTHSQSCKSFILDVIPLPEIIEEYFDFFGNKVYYFIIEEEHEKLIVTTTSTIEKKPANPDINPPSLQSWELVRDLFLQSKGDLLDEKQFVIPSDITAPLESIIQYTLPSFFPGRPLFEAVSDLMSRIYKDFKYSSGFTTISTPLSTVMQERKGVCQDFAHLAIACIQSMGLATRYVSGYLETIAPPGKEKLTGADASHAWFSVFIPDMGWIDFDPTNNKIPDEQYITIGWGRNYFDIIPLRGVIMSTNAHELAISVEVTRLF
jgi:transglutaminase-like putative cysteine protease